MHIYREHNKEADAWAEKGGRMRCVVGCHWDLWVVLSGVERASG